MNSIANVRLICAILLFQPSADVQPDVDAIFRLTHETPFAFNQGVVFICNGYILIAQEKNKIPVIYQL